ncbi:MULTISPECIES: polyprenyl synthetase family protein [Bacillaceae]|uniref:Polyprenyl synthetase family protein n=1 Tax=Evansella alkalicola TaxID=745819 RepID=A0ABS6JSX8_9BACI|nr:MULTISPECIES: polyprenyl synthetase family protein [Bacillaceae]MBU9721667.1 polyprenyl synthetase family protein [Bacillus alkalicola]
MRIHQMWDTHPNLKADLASVLELIESHIRVRDKKVETTLKELVHSGGKLLRPAFSLLCSQVGPEHNKDKSIAVAAALETLHMATLVHDDVIDESDTRHGRATLHTQYDNKFAIYSGDYLFCICFNILSRYATSLAHLEFNSRSMEKILGGELAQLNSRFKPSVSVKSYLSRVAGKTAQLFAISCYSGAIESGAKRADAMNAWNMGHYIGMAFQIKDDILDYNGEQVTLGKPVMNDIRQGVYTLPLIYAMQENASAFMPLLEKKEALTDDDMVEISELISRYRGVEKAQALAERYTQKAKKHLNRMPDGEHKAILLDIMTRLLDRRV